MNGDQMKYRELYEIFELVRGDKQKFVEIAISNYGLSLVQCYRIYRECIVWQGDVNGGAFARAVALWRSKWKPTDNKWKPGEFKQLLRAEPFNMSHRNSSALATKIADYSGIERTQINNLRRLFLDWVESRDDKQLYEHSTKTTGRFTLAVFYGIVGAGTTARNRSYALACNLAHLPDAVEQVVQLGFSTRTAQQLVGTYRAALGLPYRYSEISTRVCEPHIELINANQHLSIKQLVQLFVDSGLGSARAREVIHSVRMINPNIKSTREQIRDSLDKWIKENGTARAPAYKHLYSLGYDQRTCRRVCQLSGKLDN